MTRRLKLIIAGCCVLGLVIGIAWPPPPVPRAPENANAWTPPGTGQLERFSAEAFASASTARWLGDESDPVPGSATAVTWRLAGFLEAPESQALIIVSSEPRVAQRISAGEPLADGSRLIGIERDTITVERDGCERVYQLYRDQPVRSSGACASEDGHGAEEVP